MNHHLHIGAGILLLILLFIIAIVAFLMLASASKRQARIRARQVELDHQERMASVRSHASRLRGSVPSAGGSYSGRSPQPDIGGSSTGPAASSAPATVYVDRGGSCDLVTGMLIGEMATGGLGGRETVVENTYVEPAPVQASPAADSGSGFWGASFDSGSSSSSDNSSGLDLSWG